MDWKKIEDYINEIHPLKHYLMIPRQWGGPKVVSGNCDKDWLIENYEAVCPIPKYAGHRTSMHNYGEVQHVLMKDLKVGDKFYIDNEMWTVKNTDNLSYLKAVEGNVVFLYGLDKTVDLL